MNDYIAILNILVTSLLGLSLYFQNKKIESIKSTLERENFQYRVNNEIFSTFAKTYNENYTIFNQLASQYGDTDTILVKMDPVEKGQYNKIVSEFSTALNQLYITAPDETYRMLIRNWRDGKQKYQDVGNRLLIAMRLMNYPHTEFDQEEDIKRFYYK